MSNNLVTTTGARGLAAFAGGNPFAKAAADAGVSDARRLNFNGKKGGWSVGKDDVDDGTVLAFDLWNAKYVWTAWKAKKPVESRYYSIVDGETPPPMEMMPNHWTDGKKNTDGWQLGILIKVVDPEIGVTMDTTLKADTPWRPILKMLAEYGEKMKSHLDDEGNFKIPLIEIGTDQFDTKDGDTAYAPTLNLVDWISVADMEDIKAAAAGAAEVEPAPAPEPPKTVAAKSVIPATRLGKRV